MAGGATVSNRYFSRLHFSIRSNVKIGMISDGAFRFYINLLTLNGDGSIDKDPHVNWIASQCGITIAEFVDYSQELRRADLLEKSGSWLVKNYGERQYKNPRQARYDNKRKISDGVSCEKLLDVEVEVEVSSSKKKKKRVRVKKEPSADARVVLEYLRRITGRPFEKADNIEACMKREKCTVEDCKLVIDHQWSQAGGDPDKQRWVNIVTPWRPKHFSDYLDMAKATEGKTAISKNQPLEF